MKVFGVHRRMLNRCSTEWLPLSLLMDRGACQSPRAALAVMGDLERAGFVEAARCDVEGPEFRITDAGLGAVMASGAVLEEAEHG